MWEQTCGVCGLLIVTDTREEAQVQGLYHVGREHPLEYLEATGNMPSEDWLRQQEYFIREGFAG